MNLKPERIYPFLESGLSERFTSREEHKSTDLSTASCWAEFRKSMTARKLGVWLNVIGICLLITIIIVLSVYLLFTKPTNPKDLPKDDVCMTNECIKLAADLMNSIDPKIDPCVNFYQYACGGWIANNPVFKDDEKHPMRTLSSKNHFLLKRILDKPLSEMRSEPERKAKIYYESCKNYNHEVVDHEAVKALLTKIGNLSAEEDFDPDNWSLQNMMENIAVNIDYAPVFFEWSINRNDENHTQKIMKIYKGVDALSWKALDMNMTEVQYFESQFGTSVKDLVGSENSQEYLKSFMYFEISLEYISSRVNKLEPERVMKLAELDKEIPFMNWTRYFQKMYSTLNVTIDLDIEVVVSSLQYLEGVNKLVRKKTKTKKGKRRLNDYLMLRSLASLPPHKENIDRISARTTKLGMETSGGDGCIGEIDEHMRFATAAILAREAFDERAYALVEEMINATRKVFIEGLKDLDWIDDETKEGVKKKAMAMTYSIGYPDFVAHPEKLEAYYKDLNFKHDEYFNNKMRTRMFKLKTDLLNEDTEMTWTGSLTKVNAYYNGGSNKMVFPIGTLQKPFIDMVLPESVNYARIGGIVGHEFTHAFDNIGRWYDEQGNERDWWTDKTATRFENLAECFVNQYNKYVVEGENVNGTSTLGENIADNGGLKIIYRAYLSLPETEQNPPWRLPNLDYSHKQIFFLSYAQNYCSASGREAHHKKIETDEHSPDEYRVIGTLSNFEEFSKVFNCPKNSRMNPEKKCLLW